MAASHLRACSGDDELHSETLSAILQKRTYMSITECSDVAEVEAVLRGEIVNCSLQRSADVLIDVWVQQREAGLAVCFEWEKGRMALPKASPATPIQYRNKARMVVNSEAKLSEAWADELQSSIVIKSRNYEQLEATSEFLREALLLASATSDNVVKLLDIRFRKTKKGQWQVAIITERLQGDLQFELMQKSSMAQAYSEKEILSILKQVATGLLSAKVKGIAHRNLMLSNVLRNHSGICYIASFKTHNFPLLVPEAKRKNTEIDNYASDVFSLGLCILSLAKGSVVVFDSKVKRADLAALLGSELEKAPPCISHLLHLMLQIDPRDRPLLELVLIEATYLLDNPLEKSAEAAWYLGIARQQHAEQRFVVSAVMLEKAWECLLECDPISAVDVALELTEALLTQLSFFASASRVLKRSIEVLQQVNPNSKAVSSLRVWEVAAHFYRADFLSAISAATALLREPAVSQAAEDYWSLAYYLLMSLWSLDQFAEAARSCQLVFEREFEERNPKAQVYYLYLQAISAFIRKSYSEVQYFGLRAQAICVEHFPTFILVGELLCGIAHLHQQRGELETAEKVLEQASQLLGRFYPHSFAAARAYSQLAVLCRERGCFTRACENHRQAYDIFACYFHESINVGNNLNNWGKTLADTKHFAKAQRKFAKAHAFYSQFHPCALDTAINLNNWSNTLKATGDLSECDAKYAAAHLIYSSRYSTDVNLAVNLMNWGLLCSDMGRLAEAEEKHKTAHALFSTNYSSDIGAAENLTAWGTVCVKLRRFAAAEEKFAAADLLLKSNAPTSLSLAQNFSEWGRLKKALSQLSSASQMYEAAQQIYCEHYPKHINAACNYSNWALVDYDNKNFEAAVEKHKKANSLFLELHSQSVSAGENLFNWGLALAELNQFSEAKEKHALAHGVYLAFGKDSVQIGHNLVHLALAARSVKDYGSAILGLQAAMRTYLQVNSRKDIAKVAHMIKAMYEN